VHVEQEPNEIENNGLHKRIPSMILYYSTKFGDSRAQILSIPWLFGETDIKT